VAYTERTSFQSDDRGQSHRRINRNGRSQARPDLAGGGGAMSDTAPGPVAATPAIADSFSPQAVHLVRTVTMANVALSQMADQKASIMMGATFLVFTISIGQASRGPFPLSLAVLALFAFVSALLAMAAVLPAVKPRKRPQAAQNILFFGVFAQMSEDEFTDRVLQQLRTDDGMFRTMLRDIHQNGTVLHRKKYRFLGYAYWAFLIGLSLTAVLFLLERGGVLPVALLNLTP
jgi:hypothetical protein